MVDDFQAHACPKSATVSATTSSSDGTASIAAEHGAVVRGVPTCAGAEGASVVRQMLRDISTPTTTVMVDGVTRTAEKYRSFWRLRS